MLKMFENDLEEIEDMVIEEVENFLSVRLADPNEKNTWKVSLVREWAKIDGSSDEENIFRVELSQKVSRRGLPGAFDPSDIALDKELGSKDLVEHAVLVETCCHHPLDFETLGYTTWDIEEGYAHRPTSLDKNTLEFRRTCSTRLQCYNTPYSNLSFLCPFNGVSRFLWFAAAGCGTCTGCFRFIILKRKIRPVHPGVESWSSASFSCTPSSHYRLKFVGPWHIQSDFTLQSVFQSCRRVPTSQVVTVQTMGR